MAVDLLLGMVWSFAGLAALLLSLLISLFIGAFIRMGQR